MSHYYIKSSRVIWLPSHKSATDRHNRRKPNVFSWWQRLRATYHSFAKNCIKIIKRIIGRR